MDFLREVRRDRSLNAATAAKAVHFKQVLTEARNDQFETVTAIAISLMIVAGYVALIRFFLPSTSSTFLIGILLQIGPSFFLISSFLLSARLTSVTRDEYVLTIAGLFVSPIWLLFAALIGLCVAFPLPVGFIWGTLVGVAFGSHRSVNIGLAIGIATMIVGVIAAAFLSVFDDVSLALAVMAATMGVFIPFGTTYLALAHRVAIRPHDACQMCGYLLTGFHSGRCPECGTNTAPSAN